MSTGARDGEEEDADRTRVNPPGWPTGAPPPRADDPDQTVVSGLPLRQSTQPAQAHAAPAPLLPRPPLRKPALALPPGFRLHEYRIDSVLGQGGFGITYLATDVNLNSRVAIKEYLPEDIAFRRNGQTVSAHSSQHLDRYRQGLDSFLVEARTLATFRHPNIVRVARFFEAHQTAYMVLEYERGAPLKDWWPRRGDKTEKGLCQLIEPLLDGLAVVHGAGFLHRDIKPDNIQVRRADLSLVLLDFGSARQALGAAAEQAEVAVTPGYAPPEQYQDGPQGPWTDIYALGATLYWMISGHKPPDALDRLQAGRQDPLRPLAELKPAGYGAAFLAAVDWALRLAPGERPPDIAAWRTRLFAGQAAHLGLQDALRAAELQQVPRQLGRRLLAGLRRALAPADWPLGVKLGLTVVLTALLPMSITGWYNLQQGLHSLAEAELSNLQLLSRSTAGRLSQLIGDSQKLARTLSVDPGFVEFLARPPGPAAAAQMHAKMRELVATNADIHLMMLMDAGGTAVVSSDPEVMGRNFAFREYFKTAMRGQPHMTGIVVGAVAGAAGMFYANPVFDAERGAVIGAVVLRIRASSFDAILREAGRGDADLVPFLIDGDGVLISHPDARLLYSSLGTLAPERAAAIRADQRFRRDSVRSLGMPELARTLLSGREQGHVDYRSSLSGAAEVAGFAAVPGNDWVVVVSETRASFEAPLQRLFVQLLWSLLLVGLLFLGLALLMARRIVRPITALTRAADALKAGNYAEATVKVSGRDELGQLARTFNVLIDVLRQRERERKRGGGGA
jgi:serine/threonine protein kinase/HAMP domain-containing protein